MVLRRWLPYLAAVLLTIFIIGNFTQWWSSGSSGKITYAPNACQVSPRTPLRIVSMGDSVAQGDGSSDNNGFRMFLYNHLKNDCSRRKVEFVGSQKAGTEPVTDHEGYSGYSIESMLSLSAENISSTLAKAPNVVLLHIGMSNMSPLKEPDIAGPDAAHERLGDLIEYIFSAAPNVVIVVAQIIWSPNFVWFDNIPVYNAAIARMVKRKAERGQRIVTVDMSPIGERYCIRNIDGTWQECEDLNDDGLRPKDEGYRKIAGYWYEGLVDATQKGMFKR